jgi:hypothetical protein
MRTLQYVLQEKPYKTDSGGGKTNNRDRPGTLDLGPFGSMPERHVLKLIFDARSGARLSDPPPQAASKALSRVNSSSTLMGLLVNRR